MLWLLGPVAQGPSSPPPWWSVTAGIIAVPAGIIGLILTVLLIKKTRLESQKFGLEIRQKQIELAAAQTEGDTTKLTELVAEPILENRRIQQILLRAIVLFFALQGWSLVRELYRAIARWAGIGLQSLLPGSNGSITEPLGLAFYVLLQLPTVGYWLVFIAIGGPLLADVLAQLAIESPRLLKYLQRPTVAVYVVVGIVVLLAAVFNQDNTL